MTAERRWTLGDFDYDLPPELIAQEPVAERGTSRLLVVRRGEREMVVGRGEREMVVGRGEAKMGGEAPPTPPSLRGPAGAEAIPSPRTESSARDQSAPLEGAEIASSAPAGPPRNDPTRRAVVESPFPALADLAFPAIIDLIPPGDLLVVNSTRVRHARLLGKRPSGAEAEVLLIHPSADGHWLAMGRPGSALRPGKFIELGDGIRIETLEVLDDGHRVVRFVGATADEAIARFGQLPLPPYIERAPTRDDEDRYQTVYARREGSVAAPTAGLHFTPAILDALAAKGVVIADLDLEVGPGTFKPVEEEDVTRHRMHEERYEIPHALTRAVEAVRARGGKVWAVGTTAVRALESAADERGIPRPGTSATALFIRPGYQFRVVDRLLTNFHLPKSTLLMLVAAFAGYATTMRAYEHAVAARYRMFSYGDAMVIL